MSALEFSLLRTDGRARRGRIRTPRGTVETPVFMPVGTQGTVKGMTPEELVDCGAEILLGNTYHLYLRPGHRVVERLGGLHRFMNWKRPILTDSGGYQAFSMTGLVRIDDRGVRFRSHIDGSDHLLTPEISMEIQAALGSDVAMVLDHCPSLPASRKEVADAVDRTTAWARRSVEAYRGAGVPFGIVQGGTYPELRERSARELIALDFPGYAVGGVSVGEPASDLVATVESTADLLPPEKPRYLMGVGRPIDLVEAVARGIDLFDCVMPTRNARNGTLFTSRGRINVKRQEYRENAGAPDPDCSCYTCRNYSLAYLRHLFLSKEILASRLNTLHNLAYYLGLMRAMRDAIGQGGFEAFRRGFLASPAAGSIAEEAP